MKERRGKAGIVLGCSIGRGVVNGTFSEGMFTTLGSMVEICNRLTPRVDDEHWLRQRDSGGPVSNDSMQQSSQTAV